MNTNKRSAQVGFYSKTRRFSIAQFVHGTVNGTCGKQAAQAVPTLCLVCAKALGIEVNGKY